MRKLLICSLLLTFMQRVSSAQVVEMNVEYNSPYDTRSFGSGPHTVEYKGYSLKEVASRILNVPEEFVLLDSVLAEKRVSIYVRTKASLRQTNLEPAFANALKRQLGLLLEKSRKEQIVNVAYLPTNDQINKNKCSADAGESKKIIEVNGTWTGYCVTIDELLNKVSEWTGKHIFNETFNRNACNLSISKGNWKQIVDNLEFNFGIVITEEKREVEFYKISASH